MLCHAIGLRWMAKGRPDFLPTEFTIMESGPRESGGADAAWRPSQAYSMAAVGSAVGLLAGYLLNESATSNGITTVRVSISQSRLSSPRQYGRPSSASRPGN